MPIEVLDRDEVRDFRALARMIIPPSETYRVPGADDDLIFSDICQSLERDFDDVRRALGDLQRAIGRRVRRSRHRAPRASGECVSGEGRSGRSWRSFAWCCFATTATTG